VLVYDEHTCFSILINFVCTGMEYISNQIDVFTHMYTFVAWPTEFVLNF
jgi:hypothetical protein